MMKQKIVRDTSTYINGHLHHRGERFVLCARCKEEVSLSVSYFDPYTKKGSQVHHKCLSDKRKQEIAKEIAAYKYG